MELLTVTDAGSEEDLVPVILMPEEEIRYYPRTCVEILKLYRTMGQKNRNRFDRLLRAVKSGVITAADLARCGTVEQAIAALDARS